jgi:transporter family protein
MKPELVLIGGVIILLWGMWGFLYKYGVVKLGLLSAVLAVSVFYTILNVVIITYLYRRGVRLPVEGTTAILMMGTAAGVAASLLFMYALQKYPGSIVIPMTALYPAISVILAILILNEEIKAVNAVGIALAIVAGYLLVK